MNTLGHSNILTYMLLHPKFSEYFCPLEIALLCSSFILMELNRDLVRRYRQVVRVYKNDTDVDNQQSKQVDELER